MVGWLNQNISDVVPQFPRVKPHFFFRFFFLIEKVGLYQIFLTEFSMATKDTYSPPAVHGGFYHLDRQENDV